MASAHRVALSLRERDAAPASGQQTIGNRVDEALIEAGEKVEKKRTRNQLLIRYCDFVWRFVERLGRKQCWHGDDIAEAQSDAIFALVRAAERFDPNRIGHNGHTCGFLTFLTRVVTDRFRDFAKKRKRYIQRFSVSLDSGHAADHHSN
jgi:DNA-directed RNA polymerase specialized sigma subunit